MRREPRKQASIMALVSGSPGGVPSRLLAVKPSYMLLRLPPPGSGSDPEEQKAPVIQGGRHYLSDRIRPNSA